MAFGPIITQFQTLKDTLSKTASINLPTDSDFPAISQRWSDFNKPTPGAIINVSCEEDISNTVKWANANNIHFLPQSGTHGFPSSFTALQNNGIIINLRALNTVNVDLANGTARVGGGTITREVIEAAHAAKAHVMTGVCNTVGIVSALMGGGMGNLISLYGLGVDNMVSCRLVTATGEVISVSEEENSDLWWGMRGAGHNFGIVSELTVKAYPQVNGGVHWTGMLGYPGSEDVAGKVWETVQGMGDMKKGMGLTVVFVRLPPDFQPLMVLQLWYAGPEDEAKKAFAPLFELNPVMNIGGPTQYTQINEANDIPCIKGGRKPVYSAGLEKLQVDKLKSIWSQWEQLSGLPDAGQSVILLEYYSHWKSHEMKEEETAFPWRKCNLHALAVLHYTDPSFDADAAVFGKRFRETLQQDTSKMVYLNFATGDEDLSVIYGSEERRTRLQGLKKKWDPEGKFNFYHPIKI
ncbi:hypothetical protein BGZ60DRAFT_552959 [Tricladium varicosporioides]|nr:hypothetical protein BGZ60DRAFT_552959 [Hymenoscyphus varicosporioides]